VKRDLFQRIGGFDERYQRYGFEDRDLYHSIDKLADGGKIRIVPQLMVQHRDRLSLDDVCDKMFEAGRYSAGIFRAKHPQAYRQTGFGKCDLSLMPTNIARLLEVLLKARPLYRSLGARVINSPAVPYRLKYFVVKFLSAAFYMAGTVKS
jgi:GT2 family glycosyltransferase